MKHLKVANGSLVVVGAGKESEVSETCLVDYAHCPESDVCWLIDAGSGCNKRDNCIIDTN